MMIFLEVILLFCFIFVFSFWGIILKKFNYWEKFVFVNYVIKSIDCSIIIYVEFIIVLIYFLD